MLRDRLKQALVEAGERGDECAVATLSLVLTALADRDQAAGEAGRHQGLDDESIEDLIATMIDQRVVEINRCESMARLDQAAQEADEMAVLQQFLPPKMTSAEIDDAVDAVIDEVGARKLKDIGRVIATLKERYPGRMDFARAKRHSCERLSGPHREGH